MPTGVRSVADLIKYNIDHADKELIPPFYNDQSRLVIQRANFHVRAESIQAGES